jgi:hypothetical protein
VRPLGLGAVRGESRGGRGGVRMIGVDEIRRGGVGSWISAASGDGPAASVH